MKRISRDPLRIDVFSLFAKHAQQEKLAIHTRDAADGFVERVRSSVDASLQNGAFIYGQRIQALFEALIVSLGAVTLLKREDAGDFYALDEGTEVPDFYVVLPTGEHLLIEVKNFFQSDPVADLLEIKETYVAGLSRYAAIMRCSLKLAIFWHRWNLWTLVSPESFSTVGDKRFLSIKDGIMKNEMSILGDKAIGTIYPLRMRILTDLSTPRTVQPDGTVQFKIADIKLYCRDAEITDPLEKNIAWYLISYGKWSSEEPEAIIEAGELVAIEERYNPDEDHGQGFEIAGWLSSMFSTFYRQATADEGRVGQVFLEAVPGQLSRLTPVGYKGKALPLWILSQAPRDSAGPRAAFAPSSPEQQ